jgi:serine/threonine-protein kinase
VVVKVMHDHVAKDPLFCERFQRETLLMARFQHHYAVTLYDASLTDPQGPCIVMEYIRGVTLDNLLQKNGRLSPTRVGRLLGQLCEVLQAAHAEGIVHRDLKPANLMVVDPDTPYEIIKVMDFGLAKLMDGATHKNPLATGTEFAVGTPGYMCPEQARGDEMDHRGDLYSVGVMLFELLSGRLPFAGKCTMDVLLAHATEEPPYFADLGLSAWVPTPIEEVVRACLAKRPEDRPASARELAERFETALAHQQALNEDALPGDDPRAAAGPAAPSPAAPGDEPARQAPEFDPNAVVHHIDAWMPETIAAYKLRGFVQDVGGEVVESVPGRIRVRLGNASPYGATKGSLSWFGLPRRPGPIEMELNLERADPERESLLHITVSLRPVNGTADDPDWRSRCVLIFCDLRGHLMARTS